VKNINNHTFDFENHEMHALSQRVFVYHFLFAKGELKEENYGGTGFSFLLLKGTSPTYLYSEFDT